jgi:seryl-tRNA synthetase
MLQVSDIKNNTENYIKRFTKRGIDVTKQFEEVLKLEEERKQNQNMLDATLATMNKLAKEIGQHFKNGEIDAANRLKENVILLKKEENKCKELHKSAVQALQSILFQIPNVPNEAVPEGKTDADNELIAEWNEGVVHNEKAIPHWEITEKYGLVDFELGTKITGAGFPVYKGKGARFQRALIQFFLDEAAAQGYTEIIPPLLVNEASGIGTGQLPDKEGQMYHVGVDDLYLIPTAEVPLTNIYRDEIVSHKDLPIQLTGHTPCFRREAGSYGKDVRGLNRLHQFDKVEIVRIEKPENSYKALDGMVAYVKGLLEKLGLEHRVLRLCGGDLGFAAAITYDLEVYSSAQKRWLEVSSVSNFETFQSNRLKLRMKTEDNKKVMPHTLNGSALALPRIVAALLENNQDEKGVKVPEVLVPYTGFEYIS